MRDEEAHLPALIAALAAQRDLTGRPLPLGAVGVTLVLNNCTDRSAAVAAGLQARFPCVPLAVVQVVLPPERAHVGYARRIALDLAADQIRCRGADGVLLTTDADTEPAPDFVAVAVDELRRGADAVGGRVLLHPADRRALSPAVRRLFLLDVGYRRWAERLDDLLDPDPADPYPRHHQNYGAALAVRASWYARVGGLPPEPNNEDVAFYERLRQAGGHFRHSLRLRALTSARRAGRATGGLADALVEWDGQAEAGVLPLVASARALERRSRFRALVRATWGRPPYGPGVCAIARLLSWSPGGVDEQLAAAPTASAAVARFESHLPDDLEREPIDHALRNLRLRVDALAGIAGARRPAATPPLADRHAQVA